MNTLFYRTSLVGNAVLGVAALALLFYKTPSAPMPVVIPAAESTTAEFSPLPKYTEAASPAFRRRWLVDQLRAMGVPNKILARIVQADLDAAWTKRSAAIALKSHGDPATMMALQLEVDKSLDNEMRSALGEEGFREWDRANMQREANSGHIEMTGSEADESYKLWKALQKRQLDIREAKLKGDLDEAGLNDEYAKAMAEFGDQMKALLGSDRYAQSQQTDASASVAALKQDLAGAHLNDAQFADILKAQQQINEQRASLEKKFGNDASSPEYAEQMKALNDARDQEYQKILGATAFDTLQKSQDPSYNQMKKYETLWGLNDENVDSVYNTLQYYQKTIQEYQMQARAREAQGQSVDWTTVKQNVKQFTDQTQKSLQTYLGEDRFNKLRQNGVFRPAQISLP